MHAISSAKTVEEKTRRVLGEIFAGLLLEAISTEKNSRHEAKTNFFVTALTGAFALLYSIPARPLPKKSLRGDN